MDELKREYSTLTLDEVAEQMKVCEAATPGPWFCKLDSVPDGKFIEAARDNYPRALAQIQQLTEEKRQLVAALRAAECANVSEYGFTCAMDRERENPMCARCRVLAAVEKEPPHASAEVLFCSDCPSVGHPDKTRCVECPRAKWNAEVKRGE